MLIIIGTTKPSIRQDKAPAPFNFEPIIYYAYESHGASLAYKPFGIDLGDIDLIPPTRQKKC